MEQIYIQGSCTYILKATSQPSVFSEETGECSKKMKDQYQSNPAKIAMIAHNLLVQYTKLSKCRFPQVPR